MTTQSRAIFTLSDAELQAIGGHGVARTFPKGAVVVTEGDTTDTLFVILEGRVKVYASDDQGREIVFVTQGPGEYFGELVLDGGLRSASVMTLEKTRLLAVAKPEYEDFVAKNPAFALNVMRKLITRVRTLSASVKSLALMDVYGRVARLLLELAEEKDGGMAIRERLTHQDLANRVGASREMVGRILKDLTEGGYITAERSRIVINRRPPEHW
jgi:CRP/FNR family transcriptional regulator, cyclic AMP receptor protein